MKNTVITFKQAKEKGEKLTMLTAYDYSTAKLIDEAGINAILVGDSLGMVVLGYEDTLSVTMEDMIHHSAAVSRGIKDTLLITDMPFMSYQTSVYALSDFFFIFLWYTLEHHCKCSCLLDCAGLVKELLCCFFTLALHLKAAKCVY